MAKAQGKLLTTFQNRRWDIKFLALQKVLAKGSLGCVVEFESYYDLYAEQLPSFWPKMQSKSGGALLHGLGTHIIDQAIVLYGLPSRVTGFIQSQHGPGYNDAFTALFHYDDGLLVTLKSSLLSPEDKQLKYWVRGGKGSYKKVVLSEGVTNLSPFANVLFPVTSTLSTPKNLKY